MTSRQGSQSPTQTLTLKASFKITKMTKGDTVTIFFINISEDRDQPRAIGEIISASSGMHLYILFVSLS
jgi:hypothetical protein